MIQKGHYLAPHSVSLVTMTRLLKLYASNNHAHRGYNIIYFSSDLKIYQPMGHLFFKTCSFRSFYHIINYKINPAISCMAMVMNQPLETSSAQNCSLRHCNIAQAAQLWSLQANQHNEQNVICFHFILYGPMLTHSNSTVEYFAAFLFK